MKYVPLPHRSIRAAVQTSSLTASIGLIGGMALQAVKGDLIHTIPLLIALPALNAMAGDYATLINAHMGDPESSRQNKKKLLKALLLCVPISAVGVIGISVLLASSQGYAYDNRFILTYGVFVFGSLSLVVTTTLMSGFILNRILSDKRVNSDDALIPVSNVLASVLMLICVSYAAWKLF